MVHNCLLAPNSLGRRVTCEGNTTFTFPLQQLTVILDRLSAPDSPLQARDFPLQPPLIVSGRITALSSRYLGFPNSPVTSPLVKQPHVFVQVLSPSCCRASRGSSVCLAAIAPQPELTTEQPRQNHHGQKRSMLMPCTEFNLPHIGFSFLAVSSSDIVVCIPN